MARTDNLTNFCEDIAESIRIVTGKTGPIQASEFDSEISKIHSIASVELTNGAYLFYNNARADIAEELLSMRKNFSSTQYMFNQATGVDIPIDFTHGELDNLTYASSYANMFSNAAKIPSIKLASTSSNQSTTAYMFNGCTSLVEADISKLNTSSVTNMEYTFQNCSNLKTLKLSGMDTSKNKNMSAFLAGCSSLEELPEGFTELNTDKVTAVSSMLAECSSLQNIDLSNMNFPLATSFNGLFKNCSSAKYIKVPKTGTSMKNIGDMFNGCDNLESIDWNGLDTSIITSINNLFASSSTDTTIEGKLDLDMSDMSLYTSLSLYGLFNGNKCCRSVKLPDLSNVTINTASGLSMMFKNATSITSIEIPVIKNTSKVTTLYEMFRGCIRLKSIKGLENIMNAGTTLSTAAGTQQGLCRMFYDCESLETVDLSSLNTANITQGSHSNYYGSCGIYEMFRGCKSLKTIDISHFVINSALRYINGLFYDCQSAETISLPDFTTGASINNTSYMFYNCSSLKTLNNIDKIPWSKITSLAYTFYNCGLTKILLPVPDTIPASKSYTGQYMFGNCPNLVEVDARALGPSNSTSRPMFNYMFANCPKLETVDISNLYNSSYMTDMFTGLFLNCTSLKNVKLHHVSGHYYAPGSYTYGINHMFDGCSSLEILDLRYFMQKGSQMHYGTRMFADCRKLRKLDLRGSGYGELGGGSSAWQSGGVANCFLNCGVDNPTPTIVYVDNAKYQGNIIAAGRTCGLNWSTANVLVVADPEEPVDMT